MRLHLQVKTSYGPTKTGWLAGSWDRTDVDRQGRTAADEFFGTEGTTLGIDLRGQMSP